MTDLGAVVLFDLPAGPQMYRVFLLPAGLQGGPRWRLLFGSAGRAAHHPPRSVRDVVGYGALKVVHARASIARGRVRQHLRELLA